VIESNNPLNLIVILNSIVIIAFILNQNDSAKDSVSTQNSSASRNPLENLTWVSLILQLSLLLIKIKSNDF
jgi:uncharacterized membrane protein